MAAPRTTAPMSRGRTPLCPPTRLMIPTAAPLAHRTMPKLNASRENGRRRTAWLTMAATPNMRIVPNGDSSIAAAIRKASSSEKASVSSRRSTRRGKDQLSARTTAKATHSATGPTPASPPAAQATASVARPAAATAPIRLRRRRGKEFLFPGDAVPAAAIPPAAVPAAAVPAAAVPAAAAPLALVPAAPRPLRREEVEGVEHLVLGGQVGAVQQLVDRLQQQAQQVRDEPEFNLHLQGAAVEVDRTGAQGAGDALVGGVEGAGVGGGVGVERTVAVDVGVAGGPDPGGAEEAGLDLVGAEVRL